jgi:hypothetical protein
VAHSFAFCAEPLLVVRLQALRVLDERAQLGDSSLGRRLARLELGVAAPRLERLPPRHARVSAPCSLLVADKRIQNVELVGGACKPSLLELPRHSDRPFGDHGEILTCRASSPRVGAGPSVGEDPAGQHEAVLALRAELRECFGTLLLEDRLRQIELRLDVRLVRARADEARVALRAEQETDRLGEDRLAGAGLAGDRVEAGVEREVGDADQHEVLDVQAAQHAGEWYAPRLRATTASSGRSPAPSCSDELFGAQSTQTRPPPAAIVVREGGGLVPTLDRVGATRVYQ